MVTNQFNNFWQTFKGFFTKKRIWKILKALFMIAGWIYRLLRFLDGEDSQ